MEGKILSIHPPSVEITKTLKTITNSEYIFRQNALIKKSSGNICVLA